MAVAAFRRGIKKIFTTEDTEVTEEEQNEESGSGLVEG